MSEKKILENVPFPQTRSFRQEIIGYFEQMKVGQCFCQKG